MNKTNRMSDAPTPTQPQPTNTPPSWLKKHKVKVIVAFVVVVIAVAIYLAMDTPWETSADPKVPETESGTGETVPRVPLVNTVRLEATDTPRMLNVYEIELFDDAGVQVPASQLTPTLGPQYSNAERFGPQYLIDGHKDSPKIDGEWRMPHTQLSEESFMQLETSEPVRLGKVMIYNRTDCCSDRIVDSDLVLKLNGEEVCRKRMTDIAPVYEMTIKPGGECELKSVS